MIGEKIFKFMDVYNKQRSNNYRCEVNENPVITKKGKKNNEGGEKSTIQAQQLSNVKEDCELIYRLIILLDGDDIDKDERLNRAFRYDSDVEKKKEFDNAMEIYNEYVLGGIEYMYETFVAGCVEVDDYTTKIFEAASDFQDEINELDYSEEVKKYF